MAQATQEAFEAAKLAYTLYGWLLQEVAKEVGWETAIRAQSRLGDRFADLYSRMFKEKCAGAELGGDVIAATLNESYQHFGSDHEIAMHGDAVAFRTTRCPIYEGLTASGMDHDTIEKVCCSATFREAELMHERFPELTAKLKFREQAQEACVEEFALAR
jgi:hypothetical protein